MQQVRVKAWCGCYPASVHRSGCKPGLAVLGARVGCKSLMLPTHSIEVQWLAFVLVHNADCKPVLCVVRCAGLWHGV